MVAVDGVVPLRASSFFKWLVPDIHGGLKEQGHLRPCHAESFPKAEIEDQGTVTQGAYNSQGVLEHKACSAGSHFPRPGQGFKPRTSAHLHFHLLHHFPIPSSHHRLLL